MSGDKYYVLESSIDSVKNGMMLSSMPDLPDDIHNDWMFGRPFTQVPEQPIPVTIQDGYEDGNPISFYYEFPVASAEFVDALLEAGVDNIAVYDAVLETEDEEIKHTGYKAINIIGLVKGAGPGTVYIGDKQMYDSSIEKLDLEPQAAKGLLMFRLAENLGTIIVHESVKQHLESKGFPDLVFIETDQALLL